MEQQTQQESRAVAKWSARGQSVAGRILAKIPNPVEVFFLRSWAILLGRRVAGLAAEAAFWTIFSLPWILLAFVSGLGVVTKYVGDQSVNEAKETLEHVVGSLFSPELATQYIEPIINEIFGETRPDLGLLGLVLAVYSGSRAVMTFVEAIMIINGEFGSRGYVKRRLVAIFVYLVGALVAFLLIPVVAAGPRLIGEWIQLSPVTITIVTGLIAIFTAVGLLMFMFHFAGVQRLSWRKSAPGALIALVGCALGTVGVSIYVRRVFNNASIYGFLAMPVALMVFAYVMSYIILIGAVINAVLADRPIFGNNNDPLGRFARIERLLATFNPSAEDPDADAVEREAALETKLEVSLETGTARRDE